MYSFEVGNTNYQLITSLITNYKLLPINALHFQASIIYVTSLTKWYKLCKYIISCFQNIKKTRSPSKYFAFTTS